MSGGVSIVRDLARNKVAPMPSASVASSTASLTPSELEQTLLRMLNLDQVQKGLRRLCKPDPITKTGKIVQVVHIIAIALVPILLLLCLGGSILVSRVNSYLQTTATQDNIKASLGVSRVIHHLQMERDRSALYASAIGPDTKNNLINQYQQTDNVIALVFSINTLNRFASEDVLLEELNHHRYELNNVEPSLTVEMEFYTDIINKYNNKFLEVIFERDIRQAWKLLVALNEVMESKEMFGLERALGSLFFSVGGFSSREQILQFSESQDVANATLFSARQFSQIVEDIYLEKVARSEQFMDVIRDMRYLIRQNPYGREIGASLENSTWWYTNMSLYIDALFNMQSDLVDRIRVILEEEESQEFTVVVTLGAVILLVIAVTPFILLSVYYLTVEMQLFSVALAERTKVLNSEKRKADSLLYALLPKYVARQLRSDRLVEAESFDEATLLFSDVVGFTSISSRSSPVQVIQMLDLFYKCFDSRIDKFDVYKIETIGDAYLIASGLPQRNGRRHASEIAGLSLDLLDQIKQLRIPHLPGTKIQIRIGVHSGSVVAGIVGNKMPRYCLFGLTVTIAAKMEATGAGGHVHVSSTTKAILEESDGFPTLAREDDEIEAEVGLPTYWLLGRTDEGLLMTAPESLASSSDVLSTMSSSTSGSFRRDDNGFKYT